MSKKIFKMYATAVDGNGEKHVVTIVGERSEEKEYSLKTASVNETKYNGEFNINYSIEKYRTLKYAFAITHPTDTFVEEVGVNIAKRRIKKNPYGVFKSKYNTCLCDDQINLILWGELNYVIKNIDKFIS